MVLGGGPIRGPAPGYRTGHWVISSVSAGAARSDGVMPTRDVSHWRRRGRLWTDCPAHANLHGITIACQPINLGLTVGLTFVPSTADLRESCLMGTSAPLASDVDVRGKRNGVTGLLLIGGGGLFCSATVSLFGGGPGPVVPDFLMGNQPGVDPPCDASDHWCLQQRSSCRDYQPLRPHRPPGTDAGLQSYFFVIMPAAAPMVVGIRGSGRRSACW